MRQTIGTAGFLMAAMFLGAIGISFAQVGIPPYNTGNASVGVGISRNGIVFCARDSSHSWGCKEIKLGPCEACHATKNTSPSMMTLALESSHQLKYWPKYQVSLADGQKTKFGGAYIQNQAGKMVLLSAYGKAVGTFPYGTRLTKPPDGSQWLFIPSQANYVLTSQMAQVLAGAMLK